MSWWKGRAARAREELGLPSKLRLPDRNALFSDAKTIVETNLKMCTQTIVPSPSPAMVLSPIWENDKGRVVVRAAIVPPRFLQRYFIGLAQQALSREQTLRFATTVLEFLVNDAEAAKKALDEVKQIWVSPEAPFKPIDVAYQGHHQLSSLILADMARKYSAQMSTVEIAMSLGLPDATLERLRKPEQPSLQGVATSLQQKMEMLRREEDEWIRAAHAPK
jgi:hypothetical protein